jgi:hypothetical protein
VPAVASVRVQALGLAPARVLEPALVSALALVLALG